MAVIWKCSRLVERLTSSLSVHSATFLCNDSIANLVAASSTVECEARQMRGQDEAKLYQEELKYARGERSE